MGKLYKYPINHIALEPFNVGLYGKYLSYSLPVPSRIASLFYSGVAMDKSGEDTMSIWEELFYGQEYYKYIYRVSLIGGVTSNSLNTEQQILYKIPCINAGQYCCKTDLPIYVSDIPVIVPQS